MIGELFLRTTMESSTIFHNTSKVKTNNDRYISRWDVLDYTKAKTEEDSYSLNTWRYKSEYSFHMVGWKMLGWAKDKDIPHLSEYANSFEKADIYKDSFDERPEVNFFTVLFGPLGL